MYRLRTLGGLGLERDGAPLEDLATYRKSLALMAVVSMHEAIGRERLMALLWPESSIERARGSLKQAVHLLRRELGAPDLLVGTTELRLNPARIECDARLFLDAIASGDPAAAVALYRGPFLEGVHLDAAAEFERWADTEREVLARRNREALEALARAAAGAGDLASEIEWWRRLQGADPLNTPVAIELIDALDRAGDRAGALRHGRVHELLLEEELGIEPDPTLVRRMERLKTPDAVSAPPGLPAKASLEVPADAVAVRAHEPPGPAAMAADPGTRPRRSRAAPMAVVLAVGLALAGFAGALVLAPWLARNDDPGGLPGIASVAVLPFVDMSADGTLEHWADGISEEILNALAGVREIRVPARTSSFHFKGRNLPVREIAGLLDVDYVLEGSIRGAGDRLRVTAQLVDARDDRHLWSATFDPAPGDLFEVQEEIARTVTSALRAELGLPATATFAGAVTPAPGAEAHELYLRGLFHWHRRSLPDLVLALRHFEEATRLEPEYAKPWAGLALVYALIPINFLPLLPADEARARLEEVARRALALDPTLAEVHAALGYSHHFEWRWEDAEREFLSALEVNPRLATANQWYAEHLAKTGRGELALVHAERALELDPLSLVIRNDIGLIQLMNRDSGRAREAWEQTLVDDPTFILPHFFLHRLDLVEGNVAEAEEWGRRWAALTGAMSMEDVTLLTRAVGDLSLRPQAQARLDRWEAEPGARWHDVAFYRTWIGDRTGAIRALERGVDAKTPMMTQLVMAPWFDPLRDDPGFERLLAQVAPWATPVAADGSLRPWGQLDPSPAPPPTG